MPQGPQPARTSTSREQPRAAGARPPGRLLFASDPVRAAADLARWRSSARLLQDAPRGTGAPVLVLPGLLAGDLSTRPVRHALRRLGHHVHGWRLGRNLGPTPAVESGLRALAERLLEQHGQPFSVIGWSLGGIYARAMASERPDAIRMVITLGTPFAMTDPSQTRATRQYERRAHLHVPGYGLPIPDHVRGPMPVPATSIWSRGDGIVSWRASLETPSPTAENIAVRASHLGLGHSPAVLWAVADRLAQPPGTWTPFTPPPHLRRLYPRVPDLRLVPPRKDEQ